MWLLIEMSVIQNSVIFYFSFYFNEQKGREFLLFEKLCFQALNAQFVDPLFNMMCCLFEQAICIPLWIVEARGIGDGNELGKRGDIASPKDIVDVLKGLFFVEAHKILI